MNPHHFGFCQCPHCPQNRQNNLRFAPNWNAQWGVLPNFRPGCSAGHCQWCELWYHYAPYYDPSEFSQGGYWAWTYAHEYLRGVPLAPLTVFKSIKHLMELVNNEIRWTRASELRGLLYKLRLLAEEVRAGRYGIMGGSPFHGRPGMGFGRLPVGRMLRLPGFGGGGGL